MITESTNDPDDVFVDADLQRLRVHYEQELKAARETIREYGPALARVKAEIEQRKAARSKLSRATT